MLPGIVSGDYALVLAQDSGDTAFKAVSISVPASGAAGAMGPMVTTSTTTVRISIDEGLSYD